MAVCYNNLWKLLIDKNMNRTELKEAAGISFNVMARIRRFGNCDGSLYVGVWKL